MIMQTQTFITPKQAAKLLNVTRKTLLNWEEQGKIKAAKTIGGQSRYLLSSLPNYDKQLVGANYENSKQKGDVYEIYVRDELTKDVDDRVWLWKDIPEGELRNVGILGSWNEHRLKRKENKLHGLPDLGCDILVKSNDEFTFVQCKHYGDNTSVRIEDLGGFYLYVLTYGINGVVYHTSKISGNIQLHRP